MTEGRLVSDISEPIPLMMNGYEFIDSMPPASPIVNFDPSIGEAVDYINFDY